MATRPDPVLDPLDRLEARLREHAAPAETFEPGDLDELSARVDAIETREKLATLPDSDPPPVLSVGWESGRPHARVRSRLLAALLIVVVGAVVAVRLIR